MDTNSTQNIDSSGKCPACGKVYEEKEPGETTYCEPSRSRVTLHPDIESPEDLNVEDVEINPPETINNPAFAGAWRKGARAAIEGKPKSACPYLMSDAIEDQPGLVLHLQLLWVINPDDVLTYWERIQSEGHPTLTNEDLYEASTWNAEIACSFAGSILGYPDLNPTGLTRYPYTRGDQIKEKAGYPHDDSVFEDLAKLTDSYVDLDNIKYDSTINDIRAHLPEDTPETSPTGSAVEPSPPEQSADPLERFKIVVDDGDSDYAWHIIDTNEDYDTGIYTLDDLPEEIIDEQRKREQNICPHNGHAFGEPMTLSEANDHFSVTKQEFAGDAPEKVCSYCWNEVQNLIETADTDTPNIDYETTGFRLRWKQKGRAREEWFDLVVSPETTFDEIDAHVTANMSTLDQMHGRLYGLEGEYENSSLEIAGGIMEGIVDKHNTRTPPISITEVFSEHNLAEGDRISLAYDLATPSYYYCIVKEEIPPSELATLLDSDDSEFITSSETAAVIKNKSS